MHKYCKNELMPYVSRYVWAETDEGHKLQGYMTDVDSKYVHLLVDEDHLRHHHAAHTKAYHYLDQNTTPKVPYSYPSYGRPPYISPSYGYQPYPPRPNNNLILPLAALTAIGLLF